MLLHGKVGDRNSSFTGGRWMAREGTFTSCTYLRYWLEVLEGCSEAATRLERLEYARKRNTYCTILCYSVLYSMYRPN